MNEDLKDQCFNQRKAIEEIKKYVHGMKRHSDLPDMNEELRGEAIANITLAYRHLEDARMRLGKAVQAIDGGTSVYPK